jgi:hypothetical protein
MKAKITQLVMAVSKIDRSYIQVALAVLALALLVVGVAAPDDGCGIGRCFN